MNRCKFLLLSLLAGGLSAARAEEIPWDAGWLFHLGDAPGAEASGWADRDWRPLDLPHDWSIEGATDPAAPTKGDGGFFPTGVGWYRKKFTAPAGWQDRRVWIEFDGVYRNSEVWLNGHGLGRRPSGFVPFRCELAPHLKIGGENVLAVRVDNSAQPNSRWYAGSGITRHVRLRITDPVHIEPDSLVIMTESLSPETAKLRVAAAIRNDSAQAEDVSLEIELFDPAGRSAATVRVTPRIAAGGVETVSLGVVLPKPQAWSPDAPRLYRAVARLAAGGRETDRGATNFGLRTVRVSAKNGFELNGTPLKLFGGNAHDDNGPLGTAAFDRAEERRAEQLKAAGFIAVRTAHNPPAPAFLAACDRLGLLVLEEAFDGWESKKLAQDYGRDFAEWWQRDLDAMILRDRNHPSVVMWDLGNEPYERGNAKGADIARKLADRARELDPTRPVTAAINGLGRTRPWPGVDPLMAALDVAGYNYEIARHAEDHARLPERVIMVSESYHTETFANQAIVQARPYVIGDFVWSALDYLGEAGIGRVFPPDEKVRPHWEGSHYPWHGAACGDIDLTGWRKPYSHYRNIVWNRGEKLYAAVRVPSPDGRPWNVSAWAPPPLLASWTWPGREDRELTVEVYSRHSSVRLYLNDRQLGEKPTTQAEEFKAVFTVPYQPGTLRAAGVDAGREVENFPLVTAGAPALLRLTADRSSLRADGQDLAFVTVELVDAAGRTVQEASDSVTYSLTGPGVIAGIGSADLTTTETYRANPRKVFQGRALVVIRTTATPGDIILTATAPNLAPASLTLDSKAVGEFASPLPSGSGSADEPLIRDLGLAKVSATLSARKPGPPTGAVQMQGPALPFGLIGPNAPPVIFISQNGAATGLPAPVALKNETVRVRVSSEILHFASFSPGHGAHLRFAPGVCIKNDHVTVQSVPVISGRTWRDQVALAKIEVRDASGIPCQITPLDTRPIEFDERAPLQPGEERPFSLPTEYDLVIPRPGKYRVTISVGCTMPGSNSKYAFIASEPLEIEVRAAPSAASNKSAP